MPDGRVGRFEVPEGTTPENAQSLIEQHLATGNPAPSPQDKGFISNVGTDIQNRIDASSNAPDLPNFIISSARIGVGVPTDISGEAIKSAFHTLPDAVTKPVDQGISDIVGKLANSSAGMSVTDFLKQHPTISNALGYASELPMGAGVAKAAPALAEKAAVGGIDAAKAVGRAVTPNIDEGMKEVANLAVKHNIPLSFDELSTSPVIKNYQKISQELPFSGQDKFRSEQLKAFNKALLKTVGSDGDRITKNALNDAFKKVGKEFDDLGNGKTFNFSPEFGQKVESILDDTTATQEAIGHFRREVKNLYYNADKNGNISGETLNRLRSRINNLSRKARNEDTADLLHDLEMTIVDHMVGEDPVAKEAFSATKRKYKNLIAIEPLAIKGKGGNINPTLLNQRVSKVYGRSHSIGEAGDIGELAQIGHELMPIPGGSDTALKEAYLKSAATAIGTAGTSAVVGIPTVAGGLAANRLIQSGLNRNQSLILKALKK